MEDLGHFGGVLIFYSLFSMEVVYRAGSRYLKATQGKFRNIRDFHSEGSKGLGCAPKNIVIPYVPATWALEGQYDGLEY